MRNRGITIQLGLLLAQVITRVSHNKRILINIVALIFILISRYFVADLNYDIIWIVLEHGLLIPSLLILQAEMFAFILLNFIL